MDRLRSDINHDDDELETNSESSQSALERMFTDVSNFNNIDIGHRESVDLERGESRIWAYLCVTSGILS